MNYLEKYNMWVNSNCVDKKTKEELKNITNKKEIEDRFYKELEFGTGGLRGIIGAGSNRMNVYTVGKATQGLALYLLNKYKNQSQISVSIAYDCRIMSKEFAKVAAVVLCANGINVNLFDSLRPTPMLSYTVRELNSNAGIVITASHNPKEYNGYKVYGIDGGQVTDKNAKEILSFIKKVKNFEDVKSMNEEKAKTDGILKIVGKEIDNTYIEKVKSLCIRKELVKEHAEDLKIIYTPIHGTGNIPVRRALGELGYNKIFIVSEQEMPDGTFPTTNYPNPEEPQVFDIALNMAKNINPDIIFGTDPDCDRIGVVVKDKDNNYKVLTGNMVGMLLTEYILSSLQERGELKNNSVIIKTIVTTKMAEEVAKYYGVGVINVLTGFKYIGEKIKEFEENKDKTFVFGFEESYGYLAGTFVRDKDAVIAATLICEMVLYYKQKGMNLYDALINLYDKYGFYKEKLVSISLRGKEGQEKIVSILEYLRHSMKSEIDGIKIVKKIDYNEGVEKDLISITENKINLPKSNVIKFILEDKSYFVVRPSGTEPKMKIYLSVIGNSLKNADEKMILLEKNIMNIINNV